MAAMVAMEMLSAHETPEAHDVSDERSVIRHEIPAFFFGYIFGVARTTDSKKENVFLLHTMGAQV